MAGEAIGMTIFTLGLVIWFFIPFYNPDRKNAQRARMAHYFGLLALAVIVVTTIWGYASVS
jgi:cytochrome b6